MGIIFFLLTSFPVKNSLAAKSSYFLQIGSYVTYRSAKRIYNRICFQNLYVSIVRTGRKKLYYTIRIGPFPDFNQALEGKKLVKLLYGLDALILKRKYRLAEVSFRIKKGTNEHCFYPENVFTSRKPVSVINSWRAYFPNSPYANYLKALIDFKEKRYESAFRNAEKSLSLGMQTASLLTLMGISMLELGHKDKALTFLERAFRENRSFGTMINYVNILIESDRTDLARKIVKTHGKEYNDNCNISSKRWCW